MLKLKERIRIESVRLFNEKGFSSVTMKQIADALQISPGNLTYHFRTKADLMGAIYRAMQEQAKDYIYPQGYITLHHFEDMLMKFYRLMQMYSFFFNDVVHIVRQFPEVGKMYEVTNLQRFKEGRKLIDYYVETGRMVSAQGDIDYNKLVHTIWMISAFWSSQEQVINTTRYTVNKVLPIEMLWQLMFPFLTEKGWEEYRQIKRYVKLPR